VSLDLLDPGVRRLFSSLRHTGALEGPGVARGEAGREQRGTRVRFALRRSGSTIIEARFQAYGCPHTLAVCEWLAQRLEAGEGPQVGTPTEWARKLNIPAAKLGRLLVVEDALRAALEAKT
jgi:hypothetical protein